MQLHWVCSCQYNQCATGGRSSDRAMSDSTANRWKLVIEKLVKLFGQCVVWHAFVLSVSAVSDWVPSLSSVAGWEASVGKNLESLIGCLLCSCCAWPLCDTNDSSQKLHW